MPSHCQEFFLIIRLLTVELLPIEHGQPFHGKSCVIVNFLLLKAKSLLLLLSPMAKLLLSATS
jgi:hypothetical protein